MGALGALGVVGLLLVGSIYLLGQQMAGPLQRSVGLLAWTDHRLSQMTAILSEARESELKLYLEPGSAAAGQHMLALEAAQRKVSNIATSTSLAENATGGARLFAQMVDAYADRSAAATAAERTLGIEPQAGLRGVLHAGLGRLHMLLGTGDPLLAASLEALQGPENEVSLSVVPLDLTGWQARAATFRAQLAGSELIDASAKSAVAAELAAYENSMAAFATARAGALDSRRASERAYEDARSAGSAVLGLTTFQSERAQEELAAVREAIDGWMQSMTAFVMVAVGVLAWCIGRGISHPLTRVAALTNRLAVGDVDVEIKYIEREDEIGDVARALAVFRSTIDANRVATDQIYRLAHHDELTGLANRALLQERMLEALGRSERGGSSIAVLCLDLDGFKAVNDLYGHAAGDRLLREFAGRLLRTIRTVDIASRLGGDEFVIVQEGLSEPAAARALVERLLPSLTEPYDLDGNGTFGTVTSSIGVAIYPEDGQDPDELLRNADTALYRAKWAGKNGVAYFRPEMDRELRERRAMEQDLQSANLRGEFKLAWQPLAETAEPGRVTGFEVLLRWHHPERGLVPPDIFIPVAEASGAIGAIGSWVLHEACLEAAGWSEPLDVAVNVSPLQVQQGDSFAEMVEHVLATTGLSPSRLMLEVTEGVLIRDPDRVLTTLRRIKLLGVRIALDDFGTGYSSLATLRAFPFDKIKIDKSFTLGITAEGQDAAIVRAVLGLARGLGLPVVAEGIETLAQLQALQGEGCAEVQGWLIGRPSPIATFAGVVTAPSVKRSAA